ncbi:MAG TPA: CDP-alcohol phosphatidyltransferase family protein [Flavipsychrobacter sp.]|nr:CDP-alcohol phosphatidyltransferase family protein [Flavipsychrobacter sp.]
MQKTSYYIINAVTIYRLVASFFLLYLVFTEQPDIFKWMLAVSFFTDAIDGFLARKYKVSSVMGARLDSIADDLTILVAIIGVFKLKPEFVRQELVLIIIMLALVVIQTVMALVRYKKVSSFHTYLAKLAAVLQGSFLILLFFVSQTPLWLFYIAVVVTIVELSEEIILVILLPEWQANVKGLYWVTKKKRGNR